MRITGSNIVARPAAVKAAERAAIAAGVTEDMLIENAVSGLMKAVGETRQVTVAYGGGNNGADGLTLARHLAAEGRQVTLVAACDRQRNARYRDAAVYCGAREGSLEDLVRCDLLVDAVLGTGLDRPAEGLPAAVIAAINRSPAQVLSVDVPSGLNADTGEGPSAVEAERTVTFGCVKLGLLLGDAPDLVGDVVVSPIGLKEVEAAGRLTDTSLLPPPRKKRSHKGMYGRVYVIGGSQCMPGAPVLAASAASAAGAGLVTLCSSDFGVRYDRNAAMLMRLPMLENDGFIAFDQERLDETIARADCIVVGNGMGTAPDLKHILAYLSKHFAGTLVVDADGLNAASLDKSILSGHKGGLILTPHPGELERLCGRTGSVVERAERLASELNCVVAAKDTVTVVTDGRERLFNAAGTPALAKGGSGDMLAGIVAAYACRMPPLRATAAACYKLGIAAEERYEGKDSNALLSFEVIDRIART